jgi:ribosome-associated protein
MVTEEKQPAVAGIDFARQLARLAADHRAEDVVILDLRNLSAIADFFVIATGTSDRQMRAVAEAVEDYGRSVGQRVYGRSGYESATWLLVDYVDVVLHVFDAERRQYYDLELLWGDAPRVEWEQDAAEPPAKNVKRKH